MSQWLESLGGVVVVGFILLLILVAWVIYPLWSAYQGFRDLRPTRSWTFSLRSLLAVVAASAFVVWFLGRHADDLAGLDWTRPATWLFIAAPALVLLAYAGLVWFLVSSAMARRDRSATHSRFRPDRIEIPAADTVAEMEDAATEDSNQPKHKRRRWWVRRIFGGYPALRSGRMPESPSQEDD